MKFGTVMRSPRPVSTMSCILRTHSPVRMCASF
nr:MAG TPA: hypothetical protein [Caudoviricetes sp.]